MQIARQSSGRCNRRYDVGDVVWSMAEQEPGGGRNET